VYLAAGDAGWMSPPLRIARSARDRRRGVRRHPSGGGLVFRGCGAHGFGMAASVAVVGIDVTGGVICRRVLDRRRLVFIRRAVWLLELPTAWPLPDNGETLAWCRATAGRHQLLPPRGGS